MGKSPNRINIALSRDEALVLFDWISRFNKREDTAFGDQAEQRVLWDIEAFLELALHEPLSENYVRLLTAARSRVRDSGE